MESLWGLSGHTWPALWNPTIIFNSTVRLIRCLFMVYPGNVVIFLIDLSSSKPSG